MDRTLRCDHWKADEQYFNVVLFVFQCTQSVILENLSILDFALSGEKGFNLLPYFSGLVIRVLLPRDVLLSNAATLPVDEKIGRR